MPRLLPKKPESTRRAGGCTYVEILTIAGYWGLAAAGFALAEWLWGLRWLSVIAGLALPFAAIGLFLMVCHLAERRQHVRTAANPDTHGGGQDAEPQAAAHWYFQDGDMGGLWRWRFTLVRRMTDGQRDDFALVRPGYGDAEKRRRRPGEREHLLALSHSKKETVFSPGWQELSVMVMTSADEQARLADVEDLRGVELQGWGRGYLYHSAPLPDEVYELLGEIGRWGPDPQVHEEFSKGEAEQFMRRFPVEELRRIRDKWKEEARSRGWEVE
jgi:hypothetical protein